jgi:lipoprotein signal peptidase
VQVITYPLIAESNPHEYNGIAQGLASTIVILGGLTQPLFGKIMSLHWDHTMRDGLALYSISDYQWAILIIPVAMIVAVLILSFVKETYCKSLVMELENGH